MDFGSLLNQFQQDVKKVASGETSTTSNRQRPVSEEEQSKTKRSRIEQSDLSSFPPVEEVYCICPADVATGGPEALHQLCDQINSLHTNMSAYMLYVNTGRNGVRHASRAQRLECYDVYDAPISGKNPLLEPEETTLLIWPECWTHEMLDFLADASPKAAQCAIWWLSVNNNTGRFKDWHRNDILHLYQSEYAKQHLEKNGAKHIHAMTEYIPDRITFDSPKERSIDVLYNPLKGMHYTDDILKRSQRSIKFSPIGAGEGGKDRISPEQVRTLLKKAKVYIDFGPHPGMDRLPREAALSGCVVVTNLEGAAGFRKDVPLPPKYKIKNFNPEVVHTLLKDLIDNFDERSKEMDKYREWINGQKLTMKKCVACLVEEVVKKRNKKSSS